ncbi:MAG: ABC transporter ATP-binding protein [Polyangiaceae bacterium]|nr:ABC transporter ATP-binding protein [Polyangiaceae bacterium]
MTITLRQVTKTFGPVRALLGVSMEIRPGEALSVLGANGSGKSTLLSVLGTLAKPTTGTLDHGPLGRTREEVRRVLGWVGHDLLTYADLTGRENVTLAARLHGLDPSTAYAAVAERFELGAFAERAVRTYSRGQRQRIALARALVALPKLLLLDEPTTGLDAKGVAKLGEVVREEVARGAYVVVVTHDAEFARAYGDRSVEMERGRIRN